MSKLLTILRNAPKRSSALVAMIAAAVIVPAALFAWGPDRPTYTVEKPADHVTFNSITNNPNIGDERNFVGIRENGTTGTWKDTVTAQPGKSYVVRMYVHNNAAANLNKVAKDVTASFNLPTTTAKSLQVNGFLKSSNATPAEVYDHATFTSAENFNLAYQKNTLKYYNNANGNGFTIPESVFTSTGAKLGYDKMDGNIPGCFQYAGYLTFIVTPQFAPKPTANFTIDKEVRKAGDKTFVESVATNPGDTLNYRMTVTNNGQTPLNNINLKDTLPAGVTNVPGTVRIMNANNPGGAYIEGGDNLFKGGVNIGSYTAGSNAIVIFDAKVAANNALPVCGPNTLRNVASAQPEGYNPKEDSANVTVPKTCTPPPVVVKIQVCDLTTKTVITIDEKDFNATKHSKNLDDCKPPVVVKIQVCDLTTKKVITINENDFDSKKHSKNLDDCKPPVVVKIQVCDLTTKTIITIDEKDFNATKHSKNLDDCKTPVVVKIQVCDLTTKKVITINEKDFDSKKHSKNLSDCAVVNKIQVCELATKKVISIDEKNFDSKKHSKNLDDCKTPVTIEVCETDTKKVITINENDFDATKHSKDLNDCATVTPPVTPPVTELPTTGAGSDIMTMIGAGSLIAALGYYVASRRTL